MDGSYYKVGVTVLSVIIIITCWYWQLVPVQTLLTCSHLGQNFTVDFYLMRHLWNIYVQVTFLIIRFLPEVLILVCFLLSKMQSSIYRHILWRDKCSCSLLSVTQVQFEKVPDLVSKREVYVKRGFAYIGQGHLISLILSDFRQTLSQSLAVSTAPNLSILLHMCKHSLYVACNAGASYYCVHMCVYYLIIFHVTRCILLRRTSACIEMQAFDTIEQIVYCFAELSSVAS